jgi:AcrR family transcriptional regulator
VAGREEILSAARRLGVREGWKAVTIRSVAHELGYASPLLYEHFRDKEELLTQIAVEAIAMLETRLTENLPEDSLDAARIMIERYWAFLLKHTQLYRLMNGMDGVPIEKGVVAQSAQSLCKRIEDAVRPFDEANAQALADELWALLHGMAALYLDRFAPFNPEKAIHAAMKLLSHAHGRPMARAAAK